MSISCEYRKLGYGFDLPPGYTECEYIESTGTQYIITDLPVKYSRVICKANSSSVVNDNHMFGWRSRDTGCIYHLTYWSSSWSWGNGTANFIDYTAPEVDCLSPHVFDLCASNESEFTIDGEVKATTTLDFSSFQESYKLCFFARMNSSTVYPGKWKIYLAKVIDVRDNTWHTILPALDPFGTPCMYDTIDRKPYYNAGTGQFLYKIKPTPFPIGYTELEYLESTSSTYIDTGVTPSLTDMRFECKVQCSNGYNYGGICALWDNRSGNNRYYLCYVSNSSGYGWVCSKGTLPGANAYPGSDVGIASPIEYVGHIKGSVCEMTIDGVTFTGEATDATLTSSKLPLFTSITNGGIENVAGTRLWYAKIYDEGVLVRDFLPYLDSEGVPCMVDILTGKPYYNAGTGTFKYKLK